jgi:CMP-N,N'-diacetyllegionaminic acid synthase
LLRKNLRPLAGVPLVARVGATALAMPELDRAVVSTDDEEIAAVAEASGLAAPFRRPESLSGDRIGDVDVLTHALLACETLDARRYDIVVMLQPTSPIRSPVQVRTCIDMLLERNLDSVWTVSKTDSKAHPLKQLRVDETGTLSYYDPTGAQIIARQQLTPVFHRNGICYALTRDCLLEQGKIMGARAGAIVTEGHAISIDTQWDLDLAEFMLGRDPT